MDDQVQSLRGQRQKQQQCGQLAGGGEMAQAKQGMQACARRVTCILHTLQVPMHMCAGGWMEWRLGAAPDVVEKLCNLLNQ
jgi:hypothetical protein